MKLKSLVLATMIVNIQSCSTLVVASDQFLQQNLGPIHNSQIYNTINFDDLDEELSLLPAAEEKEENSWWITRQVKHFSTKIMIKALLSYIAVQEYCSEKWDLLCRKIRSTKTMLKAVVGYIKVRKYCSDTWDSLSGRIRKVQRAIMGKNQSHECRKA